MPNETETINCPICGERCEPTGCVCGYTGEKNLATTPQGPKVDEWERAFKGAEYAKAMADGRVLRWHPVEGAPTNRPYIIGACDPEVPARWLMERKQPNTNKVIWMSDPSMPKVGHGIVATHWCEDVLGTPHIVVRTTHLPDRYT